MPDSQLIDEVTVAWTAAGLESIDTEECHDQIARFRILQVGDEGIEKYCFACSPTRCHNESVCDEIGCAAGCIAPGYDGFWFFADYHPIAVYHRDFEPRGLLIHETLHVLEQCSGRGVDRTHTDIEVWGPGGLNRQLRAR